MSLFKALGAIAVVGIAVGLVVKNDLDEKKKNKELDEFLLSDETEPVVINVPVENEFDKDILSIKNIPATITFTLEDKDKCLLFQDLLSEKGLSSDLSSDTLKVDVIYNGDDVDELLSDLKDVLTKVDAKYEACH